MGGYILKRIAFAIPTLFVVSVGIFLMVRLLPGDIIDILFGGDLSASEEVKDQARDQLGLNGSYAEQYWRWISGIFQGDFGFSLRNTEPVSNIIVDSLIVTIELVVLGLLIAVVVGVPLGVISAVKRDSVADYASRIGGLIGLSVPSFWLATLLLLFTSKVFGWVPPLTYISPFEDPIGNLSQFILPAISISVFTMAIVMRMVRNTMLEVLGPGLRPHRPRQGRRPEARHHEARPAERPDPGGYDRRLRDRGPDRGRRDRRDHLRPPRGRLRAAAGDLRPRLPRHPGDDADDRVHVHLRQLARGHPLRRPRPEDHAGMSPRRRAARPAFATDGGDAATAWGAMPRRRLASLGKWRNPIGLVGAAIIVFNVLVALFGRFVWRVDADELVADRFEDPSWAHPMGTDELGRDRLARVIHGAQVSLQVGAISVSIAVVGGVLFGMLAGYYKGIIDTILMRIVDMMFSLPGIVLAIVIAGLLGPNRRNAMIAIGIVILPAFARVVRGAVLEVMGYPYTESARALGAERLADHGPPRDPEHHRAAARPHHRLPVGRHPGRGGAELPRARHAAAGGVVGRDAEHRANLYRHQRPGCRSSRASRS